MDDLKERIRRELERIQPSPDALEDMLRRVRHRERRQRLAVGIVALALSAGALGFLVTVFLQTEPPRPAASPTGGLIAFDMGEDIYVMNPDGSDVRNLTGTDNVFESAPAWSPDGSRIAFVACTECTTPDIYVMNADGTGVTRLTDDAALDDAPAWSPDGTQIVYHSDQQAGAERQEDRDVYVVNADGTGKRRLTEGPALDGNPTWSPDGTRIAFNRLFAPTESSAIYIMSIDGSGETQLTDPSLWAVSPNWSPDGSRIAFSVVDLATTTPDVYVMNADGTGLRKLTDDPPAAVQAWSPDGSKLLIARLGAHHSLHILDLATGEITGLFTAPQPQREGFYIHNAAWGTLTVATPSPPNPPSSSPAPGWVRHTDDAGVSIDTPSAWKFNEDPVPLLVSPPMLFAVGTDPVPTGGHCAPTAALEALPTDGALFAVMEYRGVEQAYTFPPRPEAFDLGPLGGPFECWGVKTHLILFEDGGRYFQAHVIFGPDAPASLHDEVRQSLDSLVVDPLPASEQREAQCSAGQWTACPEAAWVYQVIDEANIFHLGNRDDAILGLEHDRSFALWTTWASAGGPQGTSCSEVAGLEACTVGKQMYVEVQGVRLWIEPAPSPYESLRTEAALPDSETLNRLIRAAQSVRLEQAIGAG